MAACDECGFSWEAPGISIVGALEDVARQFAPVVSGLSDRALRHRPSPSIWSVLEYTAHTRDALAWYAERIELIMAGDRPQLKPFDWDAACLDRRYNAEDPGRATTELETTSAALARRLRELEPEAWARIGIGSDGSQRTVLTLARRAGHEPVHHLHDVRMIAARPVAARH